MNEGEEFLARRISDILNAVQDLNDAAEDMGARQLVSNAQTIVNQMRRTIHTHWPQSERPNLDKLQKCAVSIMKAIEEKDDLQAVLKACQSHLESIFGDSKKPSNQILSP